MVSSSNRGRRKYPRPPLSLLCFCVRSPPSFSLTTAMSLSLSRRLTRVSPPPTDVVSWAAPARLCYLPWERRKETCLALSGPKAPPSPSSLFVFSNDLSPGCCQTTCDLASKRGFFILFFFYFSMGNWVAIHQDPRQIAYMFVSRPVSRSVGRLAWEMKQVIRWCRWES